MTDIVLTENITALTSDTLGRELSQSFLEVECPALPSWGNLPSRTVSQFLSLNSAGLLLGDVEGVHSFDPSLVADDMSSVAFVVSLGEIPEYFHSEDFLGKVGEVCSVLRDLDWERNERFHGLPPRDTTTRLVALGMHRPFPVDADTDTLGTPNFTETPLSRLVNEFALGVSGRQPDGKVVVMTERVVRAAYDYTQNPHITVDDEDGDLDIHLRLANGLLVMANLFPDGSIDASVYDDSQGRPVNVVKRMRRETTSGFDLISLFRDALNVSAY